MTTGLETPQRDPVELITSGPLSKAFKHLAIPAVIAFVGQVAFDIIDGIWIGYLSSYSIAGHGAATFILWLTYVVGGLVAMGTGSAVARAVGGSQDEDARRLIGSGVIFASVMGVLLTAAVLPIRHNVFAWMHISPEASHEASAYLTVVLFGLLPIFNFQLIRSVLNSLGHTRLVLWLTIVTLGLNIVLDPILIFGWGGLPELGVEGAAWATVVSNFLGLFAGGAWLLRHRWMRFVRGGHLDRWHRISMVGGPVAVTQLVLCAVFPLLVAMISGFPDVELAGLTMGYRVESLPFHIGLGLGMATTALVGQNVGAGQRERAWDGTVLAIRWVVLLFAPVMVVMVFFPEVCVRLLTNDPKVVEAGARYVQIVGILEVFMGLELVCEGALAGYGNTFPQMAISVPLTLLRLPLAYLLAISMELGVVGVWWAISISTGLKGIGMLICLQRLYGREPSARDSRRRRQQQESEAG